MNRKLPFQAERKIEQEETVVEEEVPSDPQVSTVTFFLSNIQASSVKKFTMKVDGRLVHQISKPIDENQVLVVKGDFKRPPKGDHIIKLSILIPAQGVYEPVEEEFNLDKHGKFIKIEVVSTREKTELSEKSTAKINFVQDHKAFKFEYVFNTWTNILVVFQQRLMHQNQN